MELHLAGRTVLVLGGSRGLGRAVAEAASAEGARVTVTSRVPQSIDTSRSIRLRGLDTAVPESIAAFLAGWGTEPVHGLFVNTGGPRPGDFDQLAQADWLAACQQLLLGPIALVRGLVPLIPTGGSILFNTSSSIRVPISHLTLSNVLRPAVEALGKTLAEELAPRGIRVNVIAPGRIATERVAQLDGARADREGSTRDAVQAAAIQNIPLGRYGDPAEFGRAAVFLLSPAAGYISGISLLVDGAQSKAL